MIVFISWADLWMLIIYSPLAGVWTGSVTDSCAWPSLPTVIGGYALAGPTIPWSFPHVPLWTCQGRIAPGIAPLIWICAVVLLSCSAGCTNATPPTLSPLVGWPG